MKLSIFEEINEKVSECKTLADLFKLWKQAHIVDDKWKETFPKCKTCGDQPDEDFKSSFCIDGVTSLKGNVPKDIEPKVDILFILKESDVSGQKNESDVFWFNECNDSPRPNYANKIKLVLEKLGVNETTTFGYMNLNKRGGYSQTTPKRLEFYVDKYNKLILKQIEIHNPNKIIFCGCFDNIANKLDPKCTKWSWIPQTLEYSKQYRSTAEAYYVYHPSYPSFLKGIDYTNAPK